MTSTPQQSEDFRQFLIDLSLKKLEVLDKLGVERKMNTYILSNSTVVLLVKYINLRFTKIEAYNKFDALVVLFDYLNNALNINMYDKATALCCIVKQITSECDIDTIVKFEDISQNIPEYIELSSHLNSNYVLK